MLRDWPEPDVPVSEISIELVLGFAEKFSGHCVSRWNTMISALRYLTPHGKLLKRRPVKIREFTPPTQAQFSALLAECDRCPRSKAGLIVRFLCFTGLRIGEARALTWANIGPDSITVPGAVCKGGRQRVIPFVPGLGEVLERLRALAGTQGAVLPRQSCRKALESSSRRALGVRWSAHLCRHFFATRCIQSGVDMPTLARWLGHRDGGALLAKTYFHLADGHSRSMAGRVDFSGGNIQHSTFNAQPSFAAV